METAHYVYILASKRRGALYVGVTGELAECVGEHKARLIDGLTSQYAINRLVYYEIRASRGAALLREKELNSLPRGLKLALIENSNPAWSDLFDDISDEQPVSA